MASLSEQAECKGNFIQIMASDKITGMAAQYQMLISKSCFNFLFKEVFNAKPLDNVSHIQTFHRILPDKILVHILCFLQNQFLFDIDNILKL